MPDLCKDKNEIVPDDPSGQAGSLLKQLTKNHTKEPSV